mmetsp:Transcript_30120/g.77680  ORF Transcript_30120/g.77680 Transcript_30120/m.77680 type:complete len:645 (-) Transcript_30120:54-1988(-)
MATSPEQSSSPFLLKPLLEGNEKVIECRDMLYIAGKDNIPNKRRFNLGKQSDRLVDEDLHSRNNEKAFNSQSLAYTKNGVQIVQTVTGILCLGSGASGLSESWMLASLARLGHCYEGWSLGVRGRLCDPKWRSPLRPGCPESSPESCLPYLTLLGKSMKCVSGLGLPCLLPPSFPLTLGEVQSEVCFSFEASLFAGEPKSEWMKGKLSAYPGFDPSVHIQPSCDRCGGAMSSPSPSIKGVAESRSHPFQSASPLLVMLLFSVEGAPVILHIPPHEARPVEGRFAFEVERAKLLNSISQLYQDITGRGSREEGDEYARSFSFSSIRLFANVTPTATQCWECLKDYVEQYNGDKAGKSSFRPPVAEGGEKRHDDKPFHACIETRVGGVVSSKWHLLFRHGRNVVRAFKTLRRGGASSVGQQGSERKRKRDEDRKGEREGEGDGRADSVHSGNSLSRGSDKKRRRPESWGGEVGGGVEGASPNAGASEEVEGQGFWAGVSFEHETMSDFDNASSVADECHSSPSKSIPEVASRQGATFKDQLRFKLRSWFETKQQGSSVPATKIQEECPVLPSPVVGEGLSLDAESHPSPLGSFGVLPPFSRVCSTSFELGEGDLHQQALGESGGIFSRTSSSSLTDGWGIGLVLND